MKPRAAESDSQREGPGPTAVAGRATQTAGAEEHVVLVPGLALGGIELLVLAARLRSAGYRPHIFWTNPWRGRLPAKAAELHRMLTARQIETPLFVGHSFGGLITLQLLNDYPRYRQGRAVTLGSPISGCGAGTRVLRLPGGRWIVGEGLTAACAGPGLAVPADSEVGSIAGRINLLIGHALCPGTPNDSIVAIPETKHPALAAHCALPVTHGDILVSGAVASQVVHFLRTGRFAEAPDADGAPHAGRPLAPTVDR